jgi:hypothetical protein
METLKPLAEITEPDFRNRIKVFIDETTGKTRSNTLKDMHDAVSGIHLNQDVPGDIQEQFTVAQNLAVYAWFCYRFHMTAELQAHATVEFALRLKLQPATDKERQFKAMFRAAVKKGLIKDSGFHYFLVPPNTNQTVPTKSGPKVVHSYSELLVELLPEMRNDLAHGATTLFDGALGTLRTAADIINQLFAEKSTQ